jgi:hypothetical protein
LNEIRVKYSKIIPLEIFFTRAVHIGGYNFKTLVGFTRTLTGTNKTTTFPFRKNFENFPFFEHIKFERSSTMTLIIICDQNYKKTQNFILVSESLNGFKNLLHKKVI